MRLRNRTKIQKYRAAKRQRSEVLSHAVRDDLFTVVVVVGGGGGCDGGGGGGRGRGMGRGRGRGCKHGRGRSVGRCLALRPANTPPIDMEAGEEAVGGGVLPDPNAVVAGNEENNGASVANGSDLGTIRGFDRVSRRGHGSG